MKYTYGIDNLRASKKVNGEKTEFVWNGQNLAGETTNSISTIYNYDVTGIAGYKKDNEEEVRYIKDPHGNVIDMQQGYDFIGSYDYSAFGNQLTSTNEDNPFRYCGEYYDNESGNIYLRNRYYNAPTGRFISEDPIKDGLNWYSYCAGNPVMMIDPSGLSNVPKDLDWNDDGFIDSKNDRKRFDSNGNGVADWIEDGYSNADDWYNDKEYNILTGITHIEQDNEICWAATSAMIINYLTGRTMSDVRIAKDAFGEHYAKGKTNSATKTHIINMKYLDGSGYQVFKTFDKKDLNKELIKLYVDNGIPIIMNFAAHSRVVVGYDYRNGKDEIIFDDPSGSKADFEVDRESILGLLQNTKIRVSGILFERVR
ncbi:hypothetical protein FMM68_02650 [Lachnospiraceae bacterium MD329]|nr:hypothetical protein [Lachnospiraceae bacterium MD329]